MSIELHGGSMIEVEVWTEIRYDSVTGLIEMATGAGDDTSHKDKFSIPEFLQELQIPRADVERALADGYEFHPRGPLKGKPWPAPAKAEK